MDPATFLRCRTLFEEAIQIEEGRREEFLRERCSGDPELLAAVRDLLAADAEADREGRLVPAALATDLSRGLDLSGLQLGEFRIVRRLGAGGMGAVYEAWQEQPRRRVAVKVSNQVLPDEARRRRFEVESEVLARLEHPAIARVIQAGVHTVDADGLHVEIPWYALEYLEDARPFTRFAREERLDLEARIRLALEVCDAVQHAHGRGVIHRDIKPENILVDRHGHLRVIDFGIARLREAESPLGSLRTAQGEILGTPAYMAPEQLGTDPDAIDTRTDVYGLGASLYELFCDRPPLALEGAHLETILVAVRERTPPRPRSLAPGLPLELEWLLLKCLEKEPARRYAAASEIGADLRRFLVGEPLSVGPPSTTYLVRKFVRRHRYFAIGALAVLVALGVGLAVALVQLQRALRAEAQATSEAGAARIAEGQAGREAAVSAGVLQLFTRSFEGAKLENRGRDLKIADVLDEVAEESLATPPPDPWVAARMHGLFGELYHSLGIYEAAERELRLADASLSAGGGSDPRAEISVLTNLVQVLIERGRPDEALEPLRAAAARADEALEPSDPLRSLLRHRLGAILYQMRDFDGAQEALASAHAMRMATVGPRDQNTLESLNTLSLVSAELGRLDEAERQTREVLEGLVELKGPNHVFTLQIRENHALLVRDRGRVEEALALLDELVALRTGAQGSDHPGTQGTRRHRLELLHSLERHDEVVRDGAELSRASADQLGAHHPATIYVDSLRCRSLLHLGRHEEVEDLTTHHLDAGLDPSTKVLKLYLGELAAIRGRSRAERGLRETGIADLRRGHEAILAVLGEDHSKSREARAWRDEAEADGG